LIKRTLALLKVADGLATFKSVYGFDYFNDLDYLVMTMTEIRQ